MQVSSSIEARKRQRQALDDTDSDDYPQLLAGDREAWNSFYDRYSGLIDRFFVRKGISEAKEREDLFNETMMVIFQKLETYDRSQGPLRNWVYGVAKNVLLQYRDNPTADNTQTTYDNEERQMFAGPSDESDHQSDPRTSQLKEAITHLKPKDQEILMLRSQLAEDVWMWDQIGQKIGIGVSAAKMRYSRALERLRKLMDVGNTF